MPLNTIHKCACGCGLTFKKNNSCRKYAPDCKTPQSQRKATKKYQKKYKRKNWKKQPNTKDSPIVCKCPLCQKKHKVKMKWIGRGMPRKYCKDCKSAASRIDTGQIPEAGHFYRHPSVMINRR